MTLIRDRRGERGETGGDKRESETKDRDMERQEETETERRVEGETGRLWASLPHG